MRLIITTRTDVSAQINEAGSNVNRVALVGHSQRVVEARIQCFEDRSWSMTYTDPWYDKLCQTVSTCLEQSLNRIASSAQSWSVNVVLPTVICTF